MKCLNPIRVYNKALGRPVWTSCGRCSNCNENRREQWLFRLDIEMKFCDFAVHCTFQYDNFHLGDNVLDKRDIQLLFKRLRNHGLIFRYYGIGEYGTRDRRKHFHVAFFIFSRISKKEFKSLVDSCWHNGFVYYTRLSHNNAAYVLHYHVRPKLVDGKPTCQFFSKGLGSVILEDPSWIKYFESSRSLSIINTKGKRIPFPRYYRKKLGIEGMELFDDVKTILDVIADYYNITKFELSKQQISSYLAILHEHDKKKLYKYNLQMKGV